MKILSLWEPWASLVALNLKAHETRSWPTEHRGRTLIHAAKHWDTGLARMIQREPFAGALGPSWKPQLGTIVCLADLTLCVPVGGLFPVEPENDLDRAFGDWSRGRYAWRFEKIRPFPEPIPWRGQQGLRDAPAELVARVREQLVRDPLETDHVRPA